MGLVLGLVFVFLPYGMWAKDELRGRMAYQCRAM